MRSNRLFKYQNFLQHCHQRLKRSTYFDGDPTKLFSVLYLIKFLDISVKLFLSVQ